MKWSQHGNVTHEGSFYLQTIFTFSYEYIIQNNEKTLSRIVVSDNISQAGLPAATWVKL